MNNPPEVSSSERPLNDKLFSAMTVGEKTGFICKALVFFVSGGFIFPTLWID